MQELARNFFDALIRMNYKYIVTRDGWYYSEINAGSDAEAITKFNNKEF